MERSYLKCVGNDVYERATTRLGHRSSFEIEVTVEELDIASVRERLRHTFPLTSTHVTGRPLN
jgi:hypothetical protein